MTIDLKSLRQNAKFTISQAELAQRLGISQTQVSRYEEAPDNVPFSLMIKWARALGVDPAALAEESEPPPPAGVDPGSPYSRLHGELRLLKEFAAAAPDAVDALPDGSPRKEDLIALANLLGRKPNLCTKGPFDGGKSTVLNALLGANSLPTSYQPATKVVTYVRHLEDRPTWMSEEVWLFRRGFNPLLWDDPTHCTDHCVVRGNLETLKQYGTHDGRHAGGTDAHFALVFLDAPLLRACNVIDLPGDDNNADDTSKAEANPVQADVIIYTSPYNAFLRAPDMMRLAQVVRELPPFEKIHPGFPPLGNLFILATHASTAVSDSDLATIFQKAASRIFVQLGETALADRGAQTGRPIDEATVRARVFPFYKELAHRRAAFDGATTALFSEILPSVWKTRADTEIIGFRERAKENLGRQIDTYREMVGNMRRAEDELARVQAEEPVRRRRLSAERARVEGAIAAYRKESLTRLERRYAELTDIDTFEALIRRHYKDKKEAQEYAGTMLLELVQHGLEKDTAALSEQFATDVKQFLDGYSQIELRLGAARRPVAIPFNVNGAFIGGMAGVASVGALAAWAATLGNLGAYIIAAKAVSLLAALGISIPGGTAAVMAFIAAIGGPATLALGIVALAAMAGWALFGESWQRRLARKIVSVYAEKGILAKWKKVIGEYWDETLVAFQKGADEVERKWTEYLNDLTAIASRETAGKDEVAARLKRLEEAREFFGGLPWRPVAAA